MRMVSASHAPRFIEMIQLGYGFLEKVYEKALVYLLQKHGLQVEQQSRLQVYYDGNVVGDYFADIIVEDKVIIELKAAEKISKAHKAQLMNYLKATHCEVGLMLNFGPKPAFERRYFGNENKPHLKESAEISPIRSIRGLSESENQ